MTHDKLIGHIISIRGDLLMEYNPDSRRILGNRGRPDLIIVGRCGLLLAEVKGTDGVLEPDQRKWGHLLEEVDMLCGAECERLGPLHAVWEPPDWFSGLIRAQLDWLR